MVAAVEGGATAPAAAPGDAALRFEDEIGAVGHELRVQSHDEAAGGDLGLVQEAPLQLCDGEVHHLPEGGKVILRRQTVGKNRGHASTLTDR